MDTNFRYGGFANAGDGRQKSVQKNLARSEAFCNALFDLIRQVLHSLHLGLFDHQQHQM